MKARWIVFGAVVGFLLALTLGFAHAQGPQGPGAAPDEGETTAVMDRMHGSELMRQMHDQMPAELRERCDALHEQMSGPMQDMPSMDGMPEGMQDTPGMGGMPWAMGGGHAAHHLGS